MKRLNKTKQGLSILDRLHVYWQLLTTADRIFAVSILAIATLLLIVFIIRWIQSKKHLKYTLFTTTCLIIILSIASSTLFYMFDDYVKYQGHVHVTDIKDDNVDYKGQTSKMKQIVYNDNPHDIKIRMTQQEFKKADIQKDETYYIRTQPMIDDGDNQVYLKHQDIKKIKKSK